MVWELRIPNLEGPMTNLAVDGGVLFVTGEPARWCAIHVRRGSIIRCGQAGLAEWGAGHTSPSVEDSTLVYSFVDGGFSSVLSHLYLRSNVSVIAVDWSTGQQRWRVTSRSSFRAQAGHIAGTPVLVGGAAFVALPVVGAVAAVSVRDGAVRWKVDVEPARGFVSVVDGRVFAATRKPSYVVLDAATGARVCEARLPGKVDRAGLAIAGATGVLTFLDGLVVAAPVSEWFSCQVDFTE